MNDDDDIGLAPIHHAARAGHADIVVFLLSRGVSVNRRSLQRQTALHYAAQSGHINVCDVLLSAGSQLHEVDLDGWTALHHAAFQGRASCCEWLIRKGADVASKNAIFCTPLHVACTSAQRECMAVLLQLGSQHDYLPPLLKPLQMLPLPPAPTEIPDGPIMEKSAVGEDLLQLLQSQAKTDAVLVSSDQKTFAVHSAIITARAPQLPLDGTPIPLASNHVQALLVLIYGGIVGATLLSAVSASRVVLDQATQELVWALEACKALQLHDLARVIQRSVVSRIGRGGPPQPDGFVPDLELLARVSPYYHLFDADFRTILGFFVHGNFSPLLQYHEERSRAGEMFYDNIAFVRVLVNVLPIDKAVRPARPSRWRHWGTPPMSVENKNVCRVMINVIKNDKLAGWFWYPVSAIDYKDPALSRAAITDYWAVCPYPMHLEGISARLENDFYVSPLEVVNDLRLVFCNSMRYNDEGSEVCDHALALYYMVGQLYAKNVGSMQGPFPEPFEQGTLDDFIDVNTPTAQSRIQRAFAVGRAPPANEVTVDTSNSLKPTTGTAKKKTKGAGGGSKRGRKDLKESDWKPLPVDDFTPGGGGGGKRKSQGGSKTKKVKAEQPQHYAPPPLPIPDIPSYDSYQSVPPPLPSAIPPAKPWTPSTRPLEVSFEEKSRLGEDIQRLREDQIMGLFTIIQRRNGALNAQADEEVELDLNTLTAETFFEVRSYVDQCLGQ